ncbi:MAG: endonuclease/exonuclease/phosphatase family protein [Saprospiraceae bacterium]
MKRFLKVLLALAAVFAVYMAVVFAHGYATDWQPPETTPLSPTQAAAQAQVRDSLVSFVIWNVGFGGNGAASDFFYDEVGMWYSGGSMVHSPKPLVDQYVAGTLDFLRNTRADVFLLQEVDFESDRSYRRRQYDEYCAALPGFAATYAQNYNCPRVPIPLLEPWNAYGAVNSGLATFSRWQPSEAVRHQLPGQYPMPDRIFQLDRCVALHRFPTGRGGKDLVVLNIHNSAYDPGDKIKAIQLPYLRDLALREFGRGNYVVIGGDWNQCPPFFKFDAFMPGKADGHMQGNVPADFFPEDWRFAYDPATPTNRKLRDPYIKGVTFETLIDFFVVSPNVQVKAVRGIGQGFAFSDHQPVYLEAILK